MSTSGPPSLLVERLDFLVTMDDEEREIENSYLLVEGGKVAEIGAGAAPEEIRNRADRVISGEGGVAVPGLINAHDHLYQSMTRAVPEGQDSGLFDWLSALYPIWSRMTPDEMVLASKVTMVELLLSGCTTTVDHTYVYPDGDASREMLAGISGAAKALGIRLRMAVGGATSDGVRSSENPSDRDLLDLYSWAAEKLPDGDRVKVAVGPSSLFAVGKTFMGEAAELASSLKVSRHTHLAESLDEREFSLKRYGEVPIPLLAKQGWLEEDVWIAHAVHVDGDEIQHFARRGAGVSHCPSSNMRLGSGIAPLRGYLDAGVRVGLGVDGSASNDGSHMLGEARQAMLLARAVGGARALGARTALRLATRGGASAIKSPHLGRLEVGGPADVAIFSTNDISLAGAGWDPVAALILSWPPRAETVVAGGRVVVESGEPTSLDLASLMAEQRGAARQLAEDLAKTG